MAAGISLAAAGLRSAAAELEIETGAKKRAVAEESAEIEVKKEPPEPEAEKPAKEPKKIEVIERAKPNPVAKQGGTPAPVNSQPAALETTLSTRTEARTFTFSVPAPRGQILDRRGYPLAQNRVVYYAAINFPYLPDATDTEIMRYAGERIVHVNQLLGANWDLPATTVLTHYKNRRWLPLLFSSPLAEDEVADISTNGMKGLILHPVYMRHYPQGALLAHVLGYVGNRPPRKLGPIEPNESLWAEGLGVEGLEQTFDELLTGHPGKINVLFEADGTKVKEETIRRPTPGRNVVTAIDLEMQQLAEKLLAENVKRGAFVVMNVRTGDIVVLASWPQFDPNIFIPSISTSDFAALQNDPEKPLFPRAYLGSYPPASTFKVVVALAALESRTINESTVFNCPISWSIGDVVMHNWAKEPEGYMNVIGALARSCNTWFYQVGVSTGTEPVTSMARRLGLGEKTGLPLKAEAEGFVPTDYWWYKKYGYYMSDGDLANVAIGQGMVETSPLQVARMMAALGNRQYVVKPRLVKQVQEYNHKVIQAYPVEQRSILNIEPYYLDVVREGMKEVVNSGRGTGTAGASSKIVVAGKTGTGQWKPAEERNIGWFAGFAPADAPVYSFAVVYEGDPGERVGGGRNAAPVVGEFFEKYLEAEENLTQLKEESEEMRIALAETEVRTINDQTVGGSIFRENEVANQYQNGDALPAETPPAQQGSGGLQRFFRRLQGR